MSSVLMMKCDRCGVQQPYTKGGRVNESPEGWVQVQVTSHNYLIYRGDFCPQCWPELQMPATWVDHDGAVHQTGRQRKE